jgi:hypothetical protein
MMDDSEESDNEFEREVVAIKKETQIVAPPAPAKLEEKRESFVKDQLRTRSSWAEIVRPRQSSSPSSAPIKQCESSVLVEKLPYPEEEEVAMDLDSKFEDTVPTALKKSFVDSSISWADKLMGRSPPPANAQKPVDQSNPIVEVKLEVASSHEAVSPPAATLARINPGWSFAEKVKGQKDAEIQQIAHFKASSVEEPQSESSSKHTIA